jgi:hypothetical protein
MMRTERRFWRMIFRSLAAWTTLLFPTVVFAQDSTVSKPPAADSSATVDVQTPTTVRAVREAPHHVMVGSDDENYLRYLQDAGLAPLYPWSIREFSQKELAALAVKQGSHPWSGKDDYRGYPSRYSFKVLPVNVVFRFNSAFPWGSNDGAVWAGRGLTSALDLGFAFRAGPLSATLNPIAFRAENTAFHLQPNGVPGNPDGDPTFAADVDRPQRFGSGAYSRLNPGESTVRLDLLGLTAGVSTANMGWGPMELYPYIIGANAPGFLHAFAGTSAPLPIWIGKIHGRVYWGKLEQSAFSPVTGTSYYSSEIESGTKRFMSGAVATFQPRGISGLEIGAARFFHSAWPREGIPRSYFTKPFQALLKNSLGNPGGFVAGTDQGISDNQLASAFFRWVFPSSSFETYGEYGREDHSADLRDFVQEPDHSRTYGLGLRKVLRSDSTSISALRFEMINYELPTLARHRGEGGIYVHTLLRQGHTNLGQPLGSDAGLGSGGGSTIAWDRYSPRGMTTFSLSRIIREQVGTFYIGGPSNPNANDVAIVLSAERSRFFSAGEFFGSLNMVRELNWQLTKDAWNINPTLGARLRF